MSVYSPPDGHRKILALDGGGIRGIIPVRCLVTFEQLAGKRCFEFFDMIAGTSVGAIIGGLLAAGKSAFEVFSLFEDHHKEFLAHV
jgi:patatin-like phospholipase/acyl hydrolase